MTTPTAMPRWHCCRCDANWTGAKLERPVQCPRCHAVAWWRPAQQRPPTYHSDTLGRVTIPED